MACANQQSYTDAVQNDVHYDEQRQSQYETKRSVDNANRNDRKRHEKKKLASKQNGEVAGLHAPIRDEQQDFSESVCSQTRPETSESNSNATAASLNQVPVQQKNTLKLNKPNKDVTGRNNSARNNSYRPRSKYQKDKKENSSGKSCIASSNTTEYSPQCNVDRNDASFACDLESSMSDPEKFGSAASARVESAEVSHFPQSGHSQFYAEQFHPVDGKLQEVLRPKSNKSEFNQTEGVGIGRNAGRTFAERSDRINLQNNHDRKSDSRELRKSDSRARQSDRRALQSGSRALQSDSRVLQSESMARQSDSTALESDSRTLQSDSRARQFDSRVLQSDSRALQSNSRALQSDSGALQSNSRALQSDSRALQSDSRALQSDGRALQSDSRTLQSDSRALQSNSRALQSDSRTLQSDSLSLQSDSRAHPSDSRTLQSDSRTLQSDSRALYSQSCPGEEFDRRTTTSESSLKSNDRDLHDRKKSNQTKRREDYKTYEREEHKRSFNESRDIGNQRDINKKTKNQSRKFSKKEEKSAGACNISSTAANEAQVLENTRHETKIVSDVLFSSRSSKHPQQNRSSCDDTNHQRRSASDRRQDPVDMSNNGGICVTTSHVSVNGNDHDWSKSCDVSPNCQHNANHVRDATRRDSLIDQLHFNSYECMVCCSVVRRDAAVWTCQNCFHMYHFYCIKKWANTPAARLVTAAVTGWRCPACQNVCRKTPTQYKCFCGKVNDPPFSRHSTPHSCGELCGKTRSKDCTHRCNILCHPGPCPPCDARVTRACLCGKDSRSSKCSELAAYRCDNICDAILNCGKHACSIVCHTGGCEPCAVDIIQTCSCSSITRTVVCGSAESFNSFSCKQVCGKKLACDKHYCAVVCHSGSCAVCTLAPSVVLCCACGQTKISDIKKAAPRLSCMDKIPTCRCLCDKVLSCGNPDRPHRCKKKCHVNACEQCDLFTKVDCRCGSLSMNMSCIEALSFIMARDNSLALDAVKSAKQRTVYCCTRRCNKKMSCGRHKCAQLCCTHTNHTCALICGYKLSCDVHKCEEICHRGNCGTCWHVSFEELYCNCGIEVIYPPVPCGTKPPDCQRPCAKQHDCSHEVLHPCHSAEACPPCTVLTSKRCMGDHELRYNIPCYRTNITCGLACNKLLPCQQHKCSLICHKGACLEDDKLCVQLCRLTRPMCGHACLELCHQGKPCPNTACRTEVVLSCECGYRQEKTMCLQMNEVINNSANDDDKTAGLEISVVADSGTSERSINWIKTGFSSQKLQKVPCNAECTKYQRRQRLALRLQIKNSSLPDKLGNPSYSQFLRDYVKQSPLFVGQIEESLSQLVTSVQLRKLPVNRTHAFKSMPKAQRRLVHELAQFYGCTTKSFDEEPNKNVVATAVRDACWRPNVTLTEFLQRKFLPRTSVPIQAKYEYVWSADETAMLNYATEPSVRAVSDVSPESDVSIADMSECCISCITCISCTTCI